MLKDILAAEEGLIKLGRDIELLWFSSTTTSSGCHYVGPPLEGASESTPGDGCKAFSFRNQSTEEMVFMEVKGCNIS